MTVMLTTYNTGIRFKEEATQITHKEGFTLHEWQSNVATLEGKPQNKGSRREDQRAKILGTQWTSRQTQSWLSLNHATLQQSQ